MFLSHNCVCDCVKEAANLRCISKSLTGRYSTPLSFSASVATCDVLHTCRKKANNLCNAVDLLEKKTRYVQHSTNAARIGMRGIKKCPTTTHRHRKTATSVYRDIS